MDMIKMHSIIWFVPPTYIFNLPINKWNTVVWDLKLFLFKFIQKKELAIFDWLFENRSLLIHVDHNYDTLPFKIIYTNPYIDFKKGA